MKKRRLLKGHFGKVVSLSWLPDSTFLVTAGQDGNVIIWNVCLAAPESSTGRGGGSSLRNIHVVAAASPGLVSWMEHSGDVR